MGSGKVSRRVVQCGARLDAAIDYVFLVIFIGDKKCRPEEAVRLVGEEFEVNIGDEEGDMWVKSGYHYDKDREVVWK